MLLVFPLAAILGGALLVVFGAGLAYDLRGIGARWIAWKRRQRDRAIQG